MDDGDNWKTKCWRQCLAKYLSKRQADLIRKHCLFTAAMISKQSLPVSSIPPLSWFLNPRTLCIHFYIALKKHLLQYFHDIFSWSFIFQYPKCSTLSSTSADPYVYEHSHLRNTEVSYTVFWRFRLLKKPFENDEYPNPVHHLTQERVNSLMNSSGCTASGSLIGQSHVSHGSTLIWQVIRIAFRPPVHPPSPPPSCQIGRASCRERV